MFAIRDSYLVAAAKLRAPTVLQVAVKCCNKLGVVMVAKRGRKPTGEPRAMRATASLPPEVYQTLQSIAKRKKVSVAWVIRDAAERYVAIEQPLLSEIGQ